MLAWVGRASISSLLTVAAVFHSRLYSLPVPLSPLSSPLSLSSPLTSPHSTAHPTLLSHYPDPDRRCFLFQCSYEMMSSTGIKIINRVIGDAVREPILISDMEYTLIGTRE